MASVASLAVIWAVTLSLEDSQKVINPPAVDLPIVAAKPVNWSHEHILVSVTTNDLQTSSDTGGQVRHSSFGSHAGTGECRVYVDDHLVDSDELADEAFWRLEGNIVHMPGGVEYVHDTPKRRLPVAFIRADKHAPWRCVAGAIYNIQAAGYPAVKFLTRPVA